MRGCVLGLCEDLKLCKEKKTRETICLSKWDKEKMKQVRFALSKEIMISKFTSEFLGSMDFEWEQVVGKDRMKQERMEMESL